MPRARFSIVVTCYNQRDFIRAAVDSTLSQNPRLRERVIVVDDGSTDGSREILEEYGDSIRVHPLPHNLGAIEARNRGAALGQGEYLVFLDGDDVLKPWALDVYERLIAERHPTVILAEATWFTGPVPTVKDEDIPRRIAFVEYPTFVEKDRPAGLSASTFVVQRKAFSDVGEWTPAIFHLDLEDLSLKLALFSMILILSPGTAFYRIHSANSILAVPPFLINLHKILDKERAGDYPGGRTRRFARHGWLGGVIVFWVKRSMRAGAYKGALRLVIVGWPMILAAIIRRAAAWIRGRQPRETLELRPDDLAGVRQHSPMKPNGTSGRS